MASAPRRRLLDDADLDEPVARGEVAPGGVERDEVPPVSRADLANLLMRRPSRRREDDGRASVDRRPPDRAASARRRARARARRERGSGRAIRAGRASRASPHRAACPPATAAVDRAPAARAASHARLGVAARAGVDPAVEPDADLDEQPRARQRRHIARLRLEGVRARAGRHQHGDRDAIAADFAHDPPSGWIVATAGSGSAAVATLPSVTDAATSRHRDARSSLHDPQVHASARAGLDDVVLDLRQQPIERFEIEPLLGDAGRACVLARERREALGLAARDLDAAVAIAGRLGARRWASPSASATTAPRRRALRG